MKFKKRTKIIGIVAILIALIGGITGYHSYSHPELKLNAKTVNVEYGADVEKYLINSIDTSIYDDKSVVDDIEFTCKKINDFSDVDVGEYTIKYKYRDSEKTLKLIVKDTTAPEIKLRNSANIFENDVIDYDSLVSVDELSSYKTSYDDSAVNYNTPGSYIAKYIVEDKYGNKNEVEIPVTVNQLLLQTTSPASISLSPEGTSKFEVSTNCNSAIFYNSSNPNVASVDNAGNIIAKSAGNATITATANGKQVSTNVVVTNPQPVKNYQSNVSADRNDDVAYTVYKTRTGDCYHRSGCRYLSRSCIPVSRSSAISQGLRACSVCNP